MEAESDGCDFFPRRFRRNLRIDIDRKDALIRELVETIARLALYTDAECDALLDRARKEVVR